jgi:hypothetical protein
MKNNISKEQKLSASKEPPKATGGGENETLDGFVAVAS